MIWVNNEDIRTEKVGTSRKEIQQALDQCRIERRPYVILSTEMQISEIRRILVPITMLEEEVYKAEICTYIARKTGAHIILLRANDYGTHAKRNTQRIITHIKSIADKTGSPISYEEQVAKHDSFSIHKDLHNEQYDHQLLVLTASREYGLDDWLFGPPELYAIRHSKVPVMLVNPRADLFSLCD